MKDETDDTTIGRGGWALVVASGVISFVVLRFPMHYQPFPSLVFALAIALIVMLILHRLAVAVNRHDDAEAERQVRKIVPASSLGEGTTRVRGVEGAQASTVVAVPVRPDPTPQRPAAVVTPLSRIEPAPIIPSENVAAPTVPATPAPPPPAPAAAAEPVDTFADLPDVWARPERTPAPVPTPQPAAAPVAADKPKAAFKTKADLAAAAADGPAALTPKVAPKAKAEPKAKVATKAKAEPKGKAEPKPKVEAKPKAEAKVDAKSKVEAKPKAEPKADAKPKAPAKAKAAAKPKAAKAVPAGLVRLSAPRGGVADDLKEIEGIGPAIEKLVNGLGFYHFDQLAAWTDEDVAKVDAELRTFKGRIERDKWVAQARIIVTEGLMAFRERAKTNDY
jgi:predicted flap endonuclease-1-like 5' DNA nuclease